MLSPGPIHLNIPFEKPLDISLKNKKRVFRFLKIFFNKSTSILRRYKRIKILIVQGIFKV